MRRFWEHFACSATAAIVILSSLQIAGWFEVPSEQDAAFNISILVADAAGCGAGAVLNRAGTRLWLTGVAAMLGGGLLAWWLARCVAPGLDVPGFICALVVTAVGALLAAAGMQKLSACSLAQSINNEIESRSREGTGATGGAHERQHSRKEGGTPRSPEDGEDY